jgi:HAD superfamily hydrolase (TIGR01457 family)
VAGTRAAIIDLDGTVYRENQLIHGADVGIEALRTAGLQTLFLTNSALDSPKSIGRKLSEFGIQTDPEQILTSGVITAKYLAEQHPESTPLVIGEETILAVFEKSGIVTTDDPDVADVLVASLDRQINYLKLTKALRALDEYTLFVSTNPDRTRPGRDGLLPSTGAITGAIERMCQREPDVVLGKPSEMASEIALTQLGVSAEDAFMIGDRLDTDIAMGNAVGMTTVLVTTGVTNAKAVEASSVRPDHVIGSLSQLSEIVDT